MPNADPGFANRKAPLGSGERNPRGAGSGREIALRMHHGNREGTGR